MKNSYKLNNMKSSECYRIENVTRRSTASWSSSMGSISCVAESGRRDSCRPAVRRVTWRTYALEVDASTNKENERWTWWWWNSDKAELSIMTSLGYPAYSHTHVSLAKSGWNKIREDVLGIRRKHIKKKRHGMEESRGNPLVTRRKPLATSQPSIKRSRRPVIIK